MLRLSVALSSVSLLLACAAGTRSVSGEPSSTALEREPAPSGFKAEEHPVWREPPLVAVPTSFAVEEDAVATNYHAHLRPDSPFVLASTPKVSCGEHVALVGREDGRVTFQEFTGGFRFRPSVEIGVLADDLVVASSLLYDESGQAFAFLGPGVQLEHIEPVDDTWARVRVVSKPELVGTIRRARVGPIYDRAQGIPSVEGGMSAALDETRSFDLYDAEGTVRVPGIKAGYAVVLGETQGRVEVIVEADFARNPLETAHVHLHGFVDALPESEDLSTQLWSGTSPAPAPFRVVPGTWLHTAPDPSTRVAPVASESADVRVVERTDVWTQVEVDTLWGAVRGFVPSDAVEPWPDTPQRIERGRLGLCVQPES